MTECILTTGGPPREVMQKKADSVRHDLMDTPIRKVLRVVGLYLLSARYRHHWIGIGVLMLFGTSWRSVKRQYAASLIYVRTVRIAGPTLPCSISWPRRRRGHEGSGNRRSRHRHTDRVAFRPCNASVAGG